MALRGPCRYGYAAKCQFAHDPLHMSWRVAMIAGAIRKRSNRGSVVMQRDRASGRGRIATTYRCQIFGNHPSKKAPREAFPPRPELEEETRWFYLPKS